MYVDEIREYCLAKKGVSEDFPFDSETLVFKVVGKMFALISLDNPDSINLKCEPEKAILLREKHPEIIPGYHMNKKHWNTVSLTGLLQNSLIVELIDHSYDCVVEKLPKKLKEQLNN